MTVLLGVGEDTCLWNDRDLGANHCCESVQPMISERVCVQRLDGARGRGRTGASKRRGYVVTSPLPSGVVWLKIRVGAPRSVRYVTVEISGNFIVILSEANASSCATSGPGTAQQARRARTRPCHDETRCPPPTAASAPTTLRQLPAGACLFSRCLADRSSGSPPQSQTVVSAPISI
eukprot:3087616-Rhodomonas_salina.2